MVAHKLGIPHYAVDEIDAFQRDVIEYFVAEYRQGRTPNPCVICNDKIKFGTMWTKARELGAEFIGTGHIMRGFLRTESAGTSARATMRQRTNRIFYLA